MMRKVTLVDVMRTYIVEHKDMEKACKLVEQVGSGEIDSVEPLSEGKFQVNTTIKINSVMWESRRKSSKKKKQINGR